MAETDTVTKISESSLKGASVRGTGKIKMQIPKHEHQNGFYSILEPTDNFGICYFSRADADLPEGSNDITLQIAG